MKISSINWSPCWRIIPSKYPPIQLFERIASPEDLDAIFELENLTNDRLRQEMGNINLVPKDQIVTGPGSSYIMAAFTHLNPLGSRFSDGKFGVFYTAKKIESAIAETKYHKEKFLRYTNEAPGECDMRVLKVTLSANLHDIRHQQKKYQKIYSPDDYVASQQLGQQLIDSQSVGIVYNSVRCAERGECAAVFRPDVLSHCQQESHLCYKWDGNVISHVYEKRAL
jgi:hypothetical protein